MQVIERTRRQDWPMNNPLIRPSDNPHLSDRSPLLSIVPKPQQLAVISSLDDLAQEAAKYLEDSIPANTRRAYAADWRCFVSWCEQHQLAALPADPQTIILYLTDRAKQLKVSSLERRVAAISAIHQAKQLDSPTQAYAVRKFVEALRSKYGSAQEGKAPTLTEDVKAMVAGLSKKRMRELQERALLLVGFAGAFRRSELVALQLGDAKQKQPSDVQFTSKGMVLTVRRSKTDQAGEGMKKAVAFGEHADTCPVRCLKAWLKAAGIVSGPIFRTVNNADQVLEQQLSDRAVARAVQRGAARAGLDASLYGGHSLRSGLATQAAMNGAKERDIAKQTGHRSMTTLRKYIKDGEMFRDNVSALVGL